MNPLIEYPDKSPVFRSQWLIDYAVKHGVTLTELRTVIVPEHAAEPRWHKLPICSFLTIFDWLAERLAEPYLGLNLLEEIDMQDFGGSAAMAYHTSTLQECCECLSRFDQTVSLATEVNFYQDKAIDQSVMEYNLLVPAHIYSKSDEMLTVGSFVKFVRLHLGSNWHPEKIHFRFSAPDDMSRLTQIFGPNLFFDRPRTSSWLNNYDLNTTINSSNPYLLEVLKNHTEELYQSAMKQTDLLAKVRHFIACAIGTDKCSAEAIAQQVFMSRRNLTRRLSERNTSFRELKNEVVLEIAQKALSETDTQISEIANQLGFSESSSFYRSFKSMKGVSPKNYRLTCKQ